MLRRQGSKVCFTKCIEYTLTDFCVAPISSESLNQRDSTHLENFNVRRVLGCSYPHYFVILDFCTFPPTRRGFSPRLRFHASG